MDRDAAMAIVREHTKNENLVKHMLCVEAAMRAYARKYDEDEEKWGIVGLLHDFDYEGHPNEEQVPDEGHPSWGVALLREKGYPEDVCEAILGHAPYTGTPRETLMAKTLYAVDELTGLIVATALVRPNKALEEVDVESVKKKWTDKSFAKGVHREQIEEGAEDLGEPLDELIRTTIDAMRGISDRLGL